MYFIHLYFLKCFLSIYFHTTFQDPDASFDVNSHDKDPQPHYDYTNENRWQFKGRSEQSASSCPQNAKVQLIFSWIEVEIIISPYISHKWIIMDDKIAILKSGRTHVSGACPHGRLTIIMSDLGIWEGNFRCRICYVCHWYFFHTNLTRLTPFTVMAASVSFSGERGLGWYWFDQLSPVLICSTRLWNGLLSLSIICPRRLL